MSKQWEDAKRLFASALERKAEERSAFLHEACGDDAELRKEVESLLANQNRADSLLENPPLSTATVADSEPLVGKQFGAYRTIQEIGHGGMATVYLAERTDQEYRKLVAIKVVTPDSTSGEEMMRRFRNERQTLAALEHPNIVRLLDGGSTADGLPYLVMDYVEGIPIDEYCDAHRLPVTQRLQLFRNVCAAVQYAHQRLVIHRDLKPGNILVTADGAVKLLDFGIAKLVNQQVLAQSLVVTRSGQRLMTPEYASPEQVRAEPVTNATDLYSLGVVLYELLTGHRPYHLKNYTVAEIEHAICDEDPEKPSTIVTRVEEQTLPDGTTTTITPEEVSRTREGKPHKLRERLHGELDMIVLTALRKEPQRRYASVYELAEDIRKHLEGLPISARPSTLRYRGTKFVRRHREATATALAFVTVTALAVGGFLYSHRAHALTERDTIVLADFTNTTGDPVFDGTLRQGLSAQLEQSPFLNLLSDERIARTLTLMSQPKDTRLTHDLARQVCQRTSSTAILDGSIAQVGARYLLTLRAVNCSSGESLASAEVQATDKNGVLDALGKIASEIRNKLGESLSSVQRYDAPAENVTTPSLEALKAYGLGYREMAKADYATAVPLLQRAVSLDPNFAMAYALLGTSYNNLNETQFATENTRRAYELKDRVSEREKFYISSHYEHFGIGNLDAARKTYELWAQTYPRDNTPPGNLGIIYATLGRYDQALSASQESVKLNPGRALPYANLLTVYLYLNRLEEAKNLVHEIQAHNLDNPVVHLCLYMIDFLQHDTSGMEREASGLLGKVGYEDLIFDYQSDTFAYGGQFAKARELTRLAAESAQHADEKEAAAGYEAEAAVREALVGNTTLAKRYARSALALSGGRDVEGLSAIALALIGETASADRVSNELNERFSENTVVQVDYLPTIRAAVALRNHMAGNAIDSLTTAMPYELGGGAQNLNFLLYPIYIRGHAFLVAHNGKAAIIEFQKILDHPGLVLNEPIGALARLGLGRAYLLAGDSAKAKAAYQDFLTLWKDADPDIPILKQAKAEYAKLQ